MLNNSTRTTTITVWIIACVALGLAVFLIFQNLSTPAIRQWDEAIYADNALEMYETGDPIVLRRNGEITFYNTKPPLVIWMQALSMHIFGINEFSVRIPSALAGVLTCLALLVFSLRTLGDLRIGAVAVLVLGTTYGFVKQHVIKTGDLDAVLVFWITCYTLLFFHFLLKKPEKHRMLFIVIGVCIACAFMAKGVAGLMPLPGLLICALLMRKARWILLQWDIWMVAAMVLIVCLGFYALREVLAPGYLYKTWFSEYTRFFTNVMSWHNHPWYYYFWNWQRLEFFTPYVYWLPVAITLGLISRSHRVPVLLLLVQTLVFVGILSYPIVKLMWYDAAVYPWLALLCAIGFIVLWDFLLQKLNASASLKEVLLVVILVLLFMIPIRSMYQRNADLRLPVDILEREGHFVRELHRSKPDLKTYKVLMMYEQNAHYTQIDFYLNAYNRHQGHNIELIRDTVHVSAGDTVAVCQENLIARLKEKYKTEIITRVETGCELLRVTE